MKKPIHILQRMAAAALTAAILLSAVSAASLGSSLRRDSLELSDTAQMTHGQMTGASAGGGQQTENVLEYRPESGLVPMVAYGSTLYGRSDIQYVANYLRSVGYTPVAGVNGGFFTMATGIPMGALITGGVVRSSGNGNTVGFFSDGSTLIGQPSLDITVTYPNGDRSSILYNKTLSTANGAILYSRDFDSSTKNTISAYNVTLQPDATSIVPGGTITAQVTAITPETASCAIPEGQFVLSMATDTEYPYSFARQIGALQVGDTVTISCTIGTEWADVQYAVGGDEMLVVNGQANTTFQLDSANRRAARTAAGLKADGTLVLYTVDGGQSGYSGGLTLPELAARMVELGCVTAVNLDGGGSTTFAAQYPGDSGLTTVNRPSDGTLRKCANFIFLARKTTEAGEAAHLHLYPYDAAVLAGGRLTLSVKATDANYNAASLPAGITYTASGGTVSDTGVFTAGSTAGTAAVRADAANGASGTRTIHVVTDPTSISVRREDTGMTVSSVTVNSGESLDFSAVAACFGYTLTAQDDCFRWSVSGGIGQIDENGTFTAASTTSGASGTITCSAGSASASVRVTVKALAPEGGTVCGFEAGEGGTVSGTGLTVSDHGDLNYVRYGKGSLQASYDLSRAPEASGAKRQVSAKMDVELPAAADTVGLWVYGDGSNNSLSLRFASAGTEVSQWMTQLNFTGWKYVTASIPDGCTAVTGISVTEYGENPTVAGTIWIDQLIASSGVLEDVTPPSVTATKSSSALQITAVDTGSGVDTVRVAIDGAEQAVTLVDGRASVALPGDGAVHQVRVTASDRCGNLTSRIVDVAGTLVNPFSDLNDHWARVYVNYCYREGMLNGSTDSSGSLVYRPDDSMTRQEFAAAVVRFLGVDTAQYSGVTLPFADAAQISTWAVNDMKAAYSLGLITGSGSGGVLYANPTDTITRQEAMAILGRTQLKGYQEDDLSGFSDGASVASWARGYIAAMVTRGVISGSGGKLNPTGTVTRGQVAKMLYSLY